MRAAHLTYLILDSQQKNPLFRSPIPDTAKHILDIGTGNGPWAVDTEDDYASTFVHAIDFSPSTILGRHQTVSSRSMMCTHQEWTFKDDMGFVHIRELYASFTEEE